MQNVLTYIAVLMPLLLDLEAFLVFLDLYKLSFACIRKKVYIYKTLGHKIKMNSNGFYCNVLLMNSLFLVQLWQ